MRRVLLSLTALLLFCVVTGCAETALEEWNYKQAHSLYVMPDGDILTYDEFEVATPPNGKCYQLHLTKHPEMFRVTTETDYCNMETFIACPHCGKKFSERQALYYLQ